MIKEGIAHHPHTLQDPKPIADFVEQSQAAPAARPAFRDETFVKSSYYGVENSYIYTQKGGYLCHLTVTAVLTVL